MSSPEPQNRLPPAPAAMDPDQYRGLLERLAREFGFQQVGVCGIDLGPHESRFLEWLQAGFHGEMSYMSRHGKRRSRPAELLPGTLSVISLRMNYWPDTAAEPWSVLENPDLGYVSRYASGRDYHKLMRKRLQALAERLQAACAGFGFRVFVDSAPVLEKPLAELAGLGWIGKHTNLINRSAGSWFFLGEIYTNLPLPPDPPNRQSHCGSCRACIDACPTGAIVAPYQLDARLCISYLTIEHPGSIPEALRPLIGNRIYGCDDCQLVCPWNRFAQSTTEADFQPRQGLDRPDLLALFAWDEAGFLQRTEGSPIRRIGHDRWLRNLAIALGNSRPRGRAEVIQALRQRRETVSPMVREHIDWALDVQTQSDVTD